MFLGFTKDGQFVISYSLQVDTDENTGFLPVYVYNLQWWWFIPYKPLKKVKKKKKAFKLLFWRFLACFSFKDLYLLISFDVAWLRWKVT